MYFNYIILEKNVKVLLNSYKNSVIIMVCIYVILQKEVFAVKIKVKAVSSEARDSNTKRRKSVNTQAVNNFEVEEKQKQIDALLDYFEKQAVDTPDLVKDKSTYLYSEEFQSLTDDDFDFNKKRREDLEQQAEHLEKVFEETTKKARRSFRWQNYAAYMLVLTVMTSCVTFSKYITEVRGSGSGTVAGFDVSVYKDARALAVNAEQFELKFEEAEADMPTTLTLKNNSDVTVRFVFTFTNAGGKHTFALTGSGVSNNTVEIKAGKSSDVVVHIYGANETVDETAQLSIRAEQVD